MKKISIITTVYNEAQTVDEAVKEIRRVMESVADRYTYEHLFIDNASTDETVLILKKLASQDPHIKILILSKNFGVLRSTMTGYRHATGDAVVCYESNLKDPPDMMLDFFNKWEEGYQVVYGVRDRTKDRALMRWMRRAFYRLVRALANEDLPQNAGGFRLVDRRVVDELARLDDYRPYLRGLISSIGFRQVGVHYNRRARPRGYSKSHLAHLIDFAINAMVSYSILPIRLCTYLGLGLAALSFSTAFIYLILKFTVWEPEVPAVAGVIILILFFSGVQLFFLGVIGEYVGAIHSQVRRKPFAIIREKVNCD